MNIVKCENGHFYDADSYKKCPHCENEIFSDDLSTVGTSSDRLYDDKTFSLYSDGEEEKTLPSDMFGRESHYGEEFESHDGDFFGKDYYPDDGEGTIPADYDSEGGIPADYDRGGGIPADFDGEGTIPADYDGEGTIPMDGRMISSLSAGGHHDYAASPDSIPSSEYEATIPAQIDVNPEDIPDYFAEGYGREEKAPDSFGGAYGMEGKAPDSFGSGYGMVEKAPDSFGGAYGMEEKAPDSFGSGYGLEEKAPDSLGSGFSSGDHFGGDYHEERPVVPMRESYGEEAQPEKHSRLTISPSFNRTKASSWPADNGENSIDFEAERLHAGTDYSPLSEAFHAGKLDRSLSTDEGLEGPADLEGLEAEEDLRSQPDPENPSNPMAEEEEISNIGWDDIPEYDDEVIPAEEDPEDDKGDSDEVFGLEEINQDETDPDDDIADDINLEEIGLEEIGLEELPQEEVVSDGLNPEEIESEENDLDEAVSDDFDSDETGPEEIAMEDFELEKVDPESFITEDVSPDTFATEESDPEESIPEEINEEINTEEDDFNPFIIPDIPSIDDGDQDDTINPVEYKSYEYANTDEEKSEEEAIREDFDRTIIYEESDRRIAGWLVCVSGSQYGHSQEIMTGPNRINLWDNPDSIILMQNDESETPDNAFITYDPSNGQFRIQVGRSGLMIYVNDELVLVPRVLKDRDRISLGDGEYIFAAFCDDRFAWDQ